MVNGNPSREGIKKITVSTDLVKRSERKKYFWMILLDLIILSHCIKGKNRL
jgi:hypothetical protein